MLKKIKTNTGCILYDSDEHLEFLYVGDYGKENNIKADFLGYKKEIYGVSHKKVDLEEKLVVTISTQKGCPMKCNFCDVHKYGFYGNITPQVLHYQITKALKESNCKKTKRLNIHFARMGEPTWNKNVIDYVKMCINGRLKEYIDYETWHPVVSTMLPKNNPKLIKFLLDWCEVKNIQLKGEAGLQLSINSTDEDQRNKQFKNMSLSLQEISDIANRLPMPIGRKYTLNFAVTKDTIIETEVLNKLFDKNKFIIKITPIHKTTLAVENGYDITGYYDYDVYKDFERPLLESGWEVIVFVPSIEEDEDRITCGNAIINNKSKIEGNNQ